VMAARSMQVARCLLLLAGEKGLSCNKAGRIGRRGPTGLGMVATASDFLLGSPDHCCSSRNSQRYAYTKRTLPGQINCRYVRPGRYLRHTPSSHLWHYR
jgi:hypothetical protein